jgi:hypothetical protein
LSYFAIAITKKDAAAIGASEQFEEIIDKKHVVCHAESISTN